MEEFARIVFRCDLSLETLITRYSPTERHREILEEFKDLNIRDYGISTLSRWGIALDAMRAEIIFSEHEAQYGMPMFSHFFPVAVNKCYHELALACQRDQPQLAIEIITALDTFSALVNSRLKHENLPYLGRAGLALNVYGYSLTRYLPILGLKLSKH